MHKIFLLILSIIFLCSLFLFNFIFIKEIHKKKLKVVIEKGETIENISTLVLKNSNYLDKRIYLTYLLLWDKFYKKINYGEFQLDSDLTLYDITILLSNSSNVYHDLLIIDGWQKFQLDEIIIKKFGESYSFEYEDILADTYKYQIHNNFEEIYKFLMLNKKLFLEKHKKNILLEKYTFDEILIISSLVEKEGIDQEDKRKVSSVIFNRLNKGMKLQIDASTIFSITKGNFKFDRKLTYNDLKINDIFNTYYVKGLPPKPICYVGRKTIEIVLENYKTDYLFYFYDRIIKKHVYSKSYKEHQAKLKKYRKIND